MRKFSFPRALRAPALMAAVMVGGCALPVGVQVAIWAVDGVSLLATQKSITDHGFSAASGEDCALHRIITGDGSGICRDNDAGTALADAGDDLLLPGDFWEQGATADDIAAVAPQEEPSEITADFDVAAFETFDEPAAALDFDMVAARAFEELEENAPDIAAGETLAAVAAAPAPGGELAAEPAAEPAALTETADASADAAATGGKLQDAEIADGRYIVIGTFRTMPNAEDLALRRRAFEPRVLVTELRSGVLYRVVVGPYEEGRRSELTGKLAKAGMFDVWAMGVTAGDWPKVLAPAPSLLVAEAE